MFNDIYIKINQKLMNIDFDSLSLSEKKQTIKKELTEYIKEKISLNSKKNKKYLNTHETDIYELINTLDSLVPYDQKENLNQLIHFILQIASGIQGYSITWYEEEREDLMDCPEVSFNDRNLWDSVVSYKGANPVNIFFFVYEIFMEQFTIRPKKTTPEVDSSILRLLYKSR